MEAAEKENIMIIVCKSHVYLKMKIKQLIQPLVRILSQIYPVHVLLIFLEDLF
jgi:branched-subunit amino acid permease